MIQHQDIKIRVFDMPRFGQQSTKERVIHAEVITGRFIRLINVLMFHYMQIADAQCFRLRMRRQLQNRKETKEGWKIFLEK